MSTWKEAAEKYLKKRFPEYQKDDSVMHVDVEIFQAGAEHACEQLKQRLEDAENVIDADNRALKEVEEKVEEKAAEIMKLESECDQLRMRLEDAEPILSRVRLCSDGCKKCAANAEAYFAKHAGEGKKP